MSAGFSLSARPRNVMSEPLQDPIVVSGVAAVSPVGHTAAVSFSSVRAGLARIGESPELRIRDERGRLMTVTCAAVAGITDGQRRYLRLFRMAVRAFAQVLINADLGGAGLKNTTLHIALAEPERPGMDHRVEQDLVRKMIQVLGLTPPVQTTLTTTGHAAVFEALTHAMSALASGGIDRAIVGAVDGYLDELTLQWLKDTDRLKTEDNPKGFIPGEAAAFLVLERQSSCAARGGRVLARLESSANSVEPNSLYDKVPCSGEGLTGAIRQAIVASGAPPEIVLTLCDLNGERYRANEWGLTLVRAFGEAGPPAVTWHPADCMGDSGAAAGALNLVFASLAADRRLANGRVLVWGSSDDGQRGAAILDLSRVQRSH